MLRTINLLAFGVSGAGFENFENPVTAATDLSCNPHRISSQCTRACESGYSFSAVRTKDQAESRYVSSKNSRIAEEMPSIT